MKNCNCTYKDSCTCPRLEDCIISDIIANNELNDFEEEIVDKDLSKDRATARKRHHNSVKEKERSIKSSNILSSKATKLPSRAPSQEISKADVRASNATKKSKRFKKQNMAQEEKKKPYRRCK